MPGDRADVSLTGRSILEALGVRGRDEAARERARREDSRCAPAGPGHAGCEERRAQHGGGRRARDAGGLGTRHHHRAGRSVRGRGGRRSRGRSRRCRRRHASSRAGPRRPLRRPRHRLHSLSERAAEGGRFDGALEPLPTIGSVGLHAASLLEAIRSLARHRRFIGCSGMTATGSPGDIRRRRTTPGGAPMHPRG
jgi:hypothetical protein